MTDNKIVPVDLYSVIDDLKKDYNIEDLEQFNMLLDEL
tara:strand:- start:18397 stop:18510 length:114 start_codon:yes stop_codon:yes gene_type:complete